MTTRDTQASSQAARTDDLLQAPTFAPDAWQMSFGERAAIEGVLAQLRPRLAIEIGTAEGGSLRRIAAYSDRVISFDLVEPEAAVAALPNVELRTGDSHELLGRELEALAAAGELVDFVLVDGDHSADGARCDMEDLLASKALKRTVILAHDTLNQEVRSGLEEVPYGEIEKAAFVDLDFVGGYVPVDPPLRGECWGGLGLVVVDEDGKFGPAHQGHRPSMAALSELIWPTAARLRGDVAPGPPSGSGDSLSERIAALRRAAGARLRGR